MKNNSNPQSMFHKKSIILLFILTFKLIKCILMANEKEYCCKTSQMAEYSSNFFKKIFRQFFRDRVLNSDRIDCCRPLFELFFYKKRRKEECLKSKMPGKYAMNTIMIAYQIEKWRKHTRYWSLFNFFPYPSLPLKNLKITPVMLSMLSKREVI